MILDIVFAGVFVAIGFIAGILYTQQQRADAIKTLQEAIATCEKTRKEIQRFQELYSTMITSLKK